VTGAASGLGAAIAALLKQEGVNVAGLDLNCILGVDLPITLDVVDATAIDTAIDRVERELGPIDYLVTAAGYYEWRPVGGTSVDEWRRMLNVHVDGTANACRSVYRRMLPRKNGSIVTIGSELALCGDRDAAHYAAAKGALHGFTKSFAMEAVTHGIRVNCVAPGPADTPLLKPEMRSPAYINSLVLKRLVAPEEVAVTVAYLLLGEHNFVGQIISPNAGAVV
jgi:2-hydroxycyclohexanecarboxyl-CoA dehydrogenase